MTSPSKLNLGSTLHIPQTDAYWSDGPAVRGMIRIATKSSRTPHENVSHDEFVRDFKQLTTFLNDAPGFYAQYLDTTPNEHFWHYFVAFNDLQSLRQAFKDAGANPRFKKLFDDIDWSHTFGSFIKVFPMAEPKDAFSTQV